MSDPLSSPLMSASASSLDALFDADPLDLTDAQFDGLIHEVRRRRDVWAAEQAAAEAKSKTKKPKAAPTTQATAVAATKPVSEMTLDDLLS